MIKNIQKRTGQIVPFDAEKITDAIRKANLESIDETFSQHQLEKLTKSVIHRIEGEETPAVEFIQDAVEKVLIKNNFASTAKAYILYRAEHAKIRDAEGDLMDIYNELTFKRAKDADIKRENANIDADTAMGTMLKYGSEGSKYFIDHHILPKDIAAAHIDGDIHIHDKDFYMLTETCCQIDLLKLFKDGFSTGHGYLREPNDIRSYAALGCIAIQANQNEMHGGQAIPNFDYSMAPGVRKTFRKLYFKELANFFAITLGMKQDDAKLLAKEIRRSLLPLGITIGGADVYKAALVDFLPAHQRACGYEEISEKLAARAHDYAYGAALDATDNATFQAMEALIHNLNTMNSRAGAQVPFSSINYGTDTSPEGRMVMKNLLLATQEGLGNGETPIFPVQIFKVKEGVNYNEGDPNYDLFQKACKVSAKRLFPNFVNIDAPYNLQYYKPGDYNSVVATMGCRTRVMSNVNGPETSGSRGNFSFTTINLPKLAIEAHGDIDKFFETFDAYITLCHDYLLDRLSIIEEKHVYNYPFLMGQGVWMDSDELKITDSIKDVLKHASYSIGFCGLAECLKALIGKHHGESEEAQALGLKIVGHMRERTDAYTEAEHRNWSTFGTPAESTAGQFQRANKKAYGEIPGVTDRDYMTNSSHVPVYYPIKAIDKIRIEAPYHALENAGHIAYIEMDGDPSKNIKAFESVVRAMHDADMGYFSINHPVDRDPVCGYTGLIENECPHCHRKEVESGHIIVERLR